MIDESQSFKQNITIFGIKTENINQALSYLMWYIGGLQGKKRCGL